jgi:hypothetical protein
MIIPPWPTMQQISDKIAYLESVKANLDSPTLCRFMGDVDRYLRWVGSEMEQSPTQLILISCSTDSESSKGLDLIHNLLSHLRPHPMLLYGANSLIRPRYRIECVTTVAVVNHYVLVDEGKTRWIRSFSTTDTNLPVSDTDVRALIESDGDYNRVFNENASEEWRACLAQIIQEVFLTLSFFKVLLLTCRLSDVYCDSGSSVLFLHRTSSTSLHWMDFNPLGMSRKPSTLRLVVVMCANFSYTRGHLFKTLIAGCLTGRHRRGSRLSPCPSANRKVWSS